VTGPINSLNDHWQKLTAEMERVIAQAVVDKEQSNRVIVTLRMVADAWEIDGTIDEIIPLIRKRAREIMAGKAKKSGRDRYTVDERQDKYGRELSNGKN
jgi:hypothetical protein